MFSSKNLTKPASYLWARGIVRNPTALTANFARPLHGIITQGAFHDSTLPKVVEHCLRAHPDAVEQAPPHVVRQADNLRHRFFAPDPLPRSFASLSSLGLGLQVPLLVPDSCMPYAKCD